MTGLNVGIIIGPLPTLWDGEFFAKLGHQSNTGGMQEYGGLGCRTEDQKYL